MGVGVAIISILQPSSGCVCMFACLFVWCDLGVVDARNKRCYASGVSLRLHIASSTWWKPLCGIQPQRLGHFTAEVSTTGTLSALLVIAHELATTAVVIIVIRTCMMKLNDLVSVRRQRDKLV